MRAILEQLRDLGVVQFISTGGHVFSDEAADVMDIMPMIASIHFGKKKVDYKPWQLNNSVMEMRNITREFVNGEVVTKVLRGVKLSVYDGEFLVLLGESGCGKSTLLNIIGGMDSATSGTVQYLGRDLSEATCAELTEYRLNSIGFIFQSYNLMPNLTAK